MDYYELFLIVALAGGWHILRNWDVADFDDKVLLKKLQVAFGVNPYFKISVEPNPRSPNKSSIVISPAGLGLPDKNYYFKNYYTSINDEIQVAYKQLIRDVVMSLGATKNSAEMFGTTMFSYEQRIADITPDSHELLNPINTYNAMKVSALPATVIMPLQDIITAMFPSTLIDEDTEVIVKSFEYIYKLSHLLSTTTDEIKNSYMMWTLVREYLPYLSSQFTSTLYAFDNELYGIADPPQRWQFCAKLVQKFMPAAVDIMLEQQNKITDNTKIIITEVFNNIREVVRRHINQYKSMTELYTHLTRKLSTIKLQIGLPEASKNVTLHDYVKLKILKANLFETYRHGINFLKKMEEARLNKNHSDDYITNLLLQQPFKVQYLPSSNIVIVPRAVLMPPWFEEQFPSNNFTYFNSIMYGRLGVEIAQAVISSILPYDSAWTAQGTEMKLLTSFHLSVNESLNLVKLPTNCLTEFVTKRNLSASEHVNVTSLDTFKHLSAVNIGLEALKLALNDKEHIHQPSLEIYEDAEIFYLSHAQSLCTITTKKQERFDNLVEFHLTEKSMFEVMWHQDRSFSDSMQCPLPSKFQCSDIF